MSVSDFKASSGQIHFVHKMGVIWCDITIYILNGQSFGHHYDEEVHTQPGSCNVISGMVWKVKEVSFDFYILY